MHTHLPFGDAAVHLASHLTTPVRALASQGLLRVAILGALASLASFSLGDASSPRHQSLAGQWQFRLDPEDHGLADSWFAKKLGGSIALPGSVELAGQGLPITTSTQWMGQVQDNSWLTSPDYARFRQPGNIKIPFWLQPTTHYEGVAWYQREIEIPEDWQDRRVVLHLERCHWQTTVWLDDVALGSNDSLSTPHEVELGSPKPGRHRLTIRVDNRMIVDIGINSHAVSDHTQGDWNGIVGEISLTASPRVWIQALRVEPHSASHSITVEGEIGNATGEAGTSRVTLLANGRRTSLPVTWTAEGGTFRAELAMGSTAKLWDEFSPKTYRLTAELGNGAIAHTAFGLREITTSGTQFLVNGRKTFFRGTLECCIFPKTGHPPTEPTEWRRIMRVAKSYGINLFRFHSYCPPEAAFQAADEVGMYVQVETCWANDSTSLGDGKPVDAWVYRETDRILKAYGNHPSFVLMAYGNEPGGDHNDTYLGAYVSHYRSKDARRLWTSGAGWPQLDVNQFHLTPDPRIQQWGEGMGSRVNKLPPATIADYAAYVLKRNVPVISHEIGQWCVYPDFREIPKYTGYLKAKNFEIFQQTLGEHHMGDLAAQFLNASGKLQTLLYKEEIESALRTPGMGGFELLDLHDFPGQGTALVGVLNPFWESKGYTSAKEYSRFCNSTVPLARLKQRVFTTADTLSAELEVSHYGPTPLRNVQTHWRFEVVGGATIASGLLHTASVPVGTVANLGRLVANLTNAPAPSHCKLVVTVTSEDGSRHENDWDVWIYSKSTATPEPPCVLIADRVTPEVEETLARGGRVLLTANPAKVPNSEKAPIAFGFSSIFWNTAWTGRQPPTTLGLLLQAKSPLFANFPTEAHSDWQWWSIVRHAQPMILDSLPSPLRPQVQVIDDWVTNRRLGLYFEGQVGKGRVAVCSIAINGDDPVTTQLRSSLYRYLGGDQFKPRVDLTLDAIKKVSGLE